MPLEAGIRIVSEPLVRQRALPRPVIPPGHVRTGPREPAAERRKDHAVALLQARLVVPQAERDRRGGRVAVFVDRGLPPIPRVDHAVRPPPADALLGLMWAPPPDPFGTLLGGPECLH